MFIIDSVFILTLAILHLNVNVSLAGMDLIDPCTVHKHFICSILKVEQMCKTSDRLSSFEQLMKGKVLEIIPGF